MAFSLAEHDQVVKRLNALQTAAMELLNLLDGRVSENDLAQAKILLNAVSRISLRLEDLFDSDYDVARNPYAGKAIWFSDKSSLP